MTVVKLLLLLSRISLSFSYLGWRRRRSSCNAVTGRWSSWSGWELCTCTNNVAIKTRHRYCTNPGSSCGGRECYGESQDFTSCLDLAVDGGWSAWGPWSSCQCIVEGETKTRDRTCDSPVPSCGGSACVGSSTETGVCAVDGGWTPWGHWGECQCDHSTGTGRRRRTRSCTNPVPACLGRDCVGESEEFLSCDDQCCQTVDGVWTDWTDWSECECDHSTGTGTRNKTRSCTNPPPSCFGRSCDGESVLSQACDDQCCMTVDGNWGAWGAWSDNCFCDHETGEGHFIRKRTCSDPSPSCFGQQCIGNSIDVKVCSEQCCKKVDGNWSGWGLWSNTCRCDHSTGTGHLDRNRTCSDPSPDCGGEECEGDATELKDCSIDCCLTVDGVWTDWTDWSECKCDHSTGTGTRNKTRSCTNPPPSCFGRQCNGSELEVTNCNDQCCLTVDGVWTDWTDWSKCECDHSTGTGTRNKTRSCTNPPPSCFGRQCEGDETAVEACSDQCCRTMNGVWTDWTDWSECECDHNTGTGTRNKTRSCTNPAPSCFGSDCIGESVNTSSCNSSCGRCDKDACEKDPTCNLEQCSGDEDGTGSASFVIDECGVDEFDIAGTCLKLYVGGVIIGVAVLLIMLATGVIIFRKRKVAKEVPYVVENQNVVNRRDFEVVDEGVLTISDRDVRYRANCCHGDSDADGDYQMFTNEHAIGTDENDYITREEKKKRPLSTYISAYSTMENADDPGPSCSSYENQSVTKLESQASQISSYENHKLPDIPKVGLNLEDGNQRNFGGPHYEEMNACSLPSPKVTANQEEPGGVRKEEHHYAEIRGSIRVDNNTEDTSNQPGNHGNNTSNQPGNGGGCQDDQSDDGLGMSGEYIDCDHIYFNPDLDMI